MYTIDNKFLEIGLPMWSVNMRVAVQFTNKHLPVSIPSEWYSVVSIAWRKKPYSVTVIPVE